VSTPVKDGAKVVRGKKVGDVERREGEAWRVGGETLVALGGFQFYTGTISWDQT